MQRLLHGAVASLDLDLTGMTVLTEAASGYFAVTPVLAALAGASRVVAVGRDSEYGRFSEVAAAIEDLADRCGVAERVFITDGQPVAHAAEANVVTNLGHVRPINRELVACLPADAAVSLMVEPWEFRPDDVDVDACRELGVPVAGTNEQHPLIRTFDYLGPLVSKLMLQSDVEIARSRVAVVASEPFGSSIGRYLASGGAETTVVDPTRGYESLALDALPPDGEAALDALVLAEMRITPPLVGESTGIPVAALAANDCLLVHVAGAVDSDALERSGIATTTRRPAPAGVMTVTTAEVGPRPVIDLHAGGLKVGGLLVAAKRRHGNARPAEDEAVASGFGLFVEPR